MLKLRWPRKGKTGETEAGAAVAAGTAASVEEATQAGGAASTQDEAHVRESLEVIKTAIVWLVVINLLTVLSPLLWLSLKWTIIVGVLLTTSSVVIGFLAYLRARSTQRRLPE